MSVCLCRDKVSELNSQRNDTELNLFWGDLFRTQSCDNLRPPKSTVITFFQESTHTENHCSLILNQMNYN